MENGSYVGGGAVTGANLGVAPEGGKSFVTRSHPIRLRYFPMVPWPACFAS
jgi:hypothetical protein